MLTSWILCGFKFLEVKFGPQITFIHVVALKPSISPSDGTKPGLFLPHMVCLLTLIYTAECTHKIIILLVFVYKV